jgi:catechol 2,3-dioxygenase-like lactoylglutathione lyase family enzyme
VKDVGLTHVALPVRNLDTAVAFYAKYARMQTVHRRPGVVWLSDKTRPFAIVLLEAEDVPNPLVPFAHLGVGCESREEVDRLSSLAQNEDRLIGGPLDYGPPVGYWAFIRDPDGHTLEVSFGQEVGLAVEVSR